MQKGMAEAHANVELGELWQDFSQGLFYCPGNIDDPAGYQKLKTLLAELDEKRGTRGKESGSLRHVCELLHGKK
jgi:glucose-6-phosphate 1-dehydrogenase